MPQFVRFALVGGLGTLTNLACFFVLVDAGGLGPLVGACLAFAIAVTQNYALNELWTFNPERTNRLGASRYAKFVLFSLSGLVVNLLVLWLLLRAYHFPLLVIPQAIGILGGTLVNFAASRLVTFR